MAGENTRHPRDMDAKKTPGVISAKHPEGSSGGNDTWSFFRIQRAKCKGKENRNDL